MSLVIIGEAATKIMDRHADFVLAQPDVPWRSMRDAQPYRARLFRYQSGCSLGNRADGVAGAAGRLAGTGRTFLTRLYLLTRLYPTLLSCSIAAGFSSVEMSCVIGSSLAIARSRRRMILPERLGQAAGVADLPGLGDGSDLARDPGAQLGGDPRGGRVLGTTKATMARRSARRGGRPRRPRPLPGARPARLDRHGAQAVPGYAQHVVDPARDRVVAGGRVAQRPARPGNKSAGNARRRPRGCAAWRARGA